MFGPITRTGFIWSTARSEHNMGSRGHPINEHRTGTASRHSSGRDAEDEICVAYWVCSTCTKDDLMTN